MRFIPEPEKPDDLQRNVITKADLERYDVSLMARYPFASIEATNNEKGEMVQWRCSVPDYFQLRLKTEKK